jgi:hypothetical protein
MHRPAIVVSTTSPFTLRASVPLPVAEAAQRNPVAASVRMPHDRHRVSIAPAASKILEQVCRDCFD